jgi:hypothetical protein
VKCGILKNFRVSLSLMGIQRRHVMHQYNCRLVGVVAYTGPFVDPKNPSNSHLLLSLCCHEFVEKMMLKAKNSLTFKILPQMSQIPFTLVMPKRF